jgi:hypothetical protein
MSFCFRFGIYIRLQRNQNLSNDRDVGNPGGNNYAVARVHCSMNALLRFLDRSGRSALSIVKYIIWKFETTQSPEKGACQECFERKTTGILTFECV